MLIDVVANMRMPTERAHGYQTVKFCEALSQEGARVRLIVPFRFSMPETREIHDLYEYYGIQRNFRIVRLPSLDLVSPLARRVPKRIAQILSAIQTWTFSVAVALFQVFSRNGVLYTRDAPVLLATLLLPRWIRRRSYFEAHQALPRSLQWVGKFWSRADGVFPISQGLRQYLEDQSLFSGVPITILHDAVDLDPYENLPESTVARQERALPEKATLALYAGHLFEWKGVYTFGLALQKTPEITGVFVGGTEKDRNDFEKFLREEQISNAVCIGHVPPTEVALYLAAADVVVLPTSGKDQIGREFTSPLKLFEYMAARRPIVASDLPSLREILVTGKNAILVPPDDPDALARGLQEIVQKPELAIHIASQARKDVDAHTWRKRAQRALDAMQHGPT